MALDVRPKGPRKLHMFYNSQSLSDCVVKFSNRRVFAHKLVLVQNSVWFDKALLGGFKEAGEFVINLGDDDDPNDVEATLKYFYHGSYTTPLITSPGQDNLGKHLAMYLLADMYYAPALRKEATTLLIACLKTSIVGPGKAIEDPAITSIKQILGPGAGDFADKTLQEEVYQLIIANIARLYKNQLFEQLLISGKMFNQNFGMKFAYKTGEILGRFYS
ncbi:hypothetical protein D6D13_10041 [Aureobasidium pullulans]|uniref:BTB domain-containing protein n=1 Tax=Aureobasidium pullulans TaxID=5580 RepID=A0A4S9C2F2_AURPU|nr:hypothetical protein D6D13_10041 [Aureobasidium pullulans]